jgi:hypothetical protein
LLPSFASKLADSKMLIVRTVSPYFSPKSAIAPSARASSRDFEMRDRHIRRNRVVDDALDAFDLLGGHRFGMVEVEAQVVGATSEPA